METYISPFFLAAAILHVLVFAKMHIPICIQKIISFAAPAAFAVYIVNVQECIWVYFMKDRFIHWSAGSPAGIIVRTCSFALLFILAVVLSDFCKRRLFHFLKISHCLQKLENALRKVIN